MEDPPPPPGTPRVGLEKRINVTFEGVGEDSVVLFLETMESRVVIAWLKLIKGV